MTPERVEEVLANYQYGQFRDRVKAEREDLYNQARARHGPKCVPCGKLLDFDVPVCIRRSNTGKVILTHPFCGIKEGTRPDPSRGRHALDALDRFKARNR